MLTLDSLLLDDVGLIKIDVEGHELAVLKGAISTLRTSRPNLIIEAEERHRPNAVQSVASFLSELGYNGIFRCDPYFNFLPVQQFDSIRHQVKAALGSVNYCANFVFSISEATLQKCATALLRRLPDGFDPVGYLALNPDVAAAGMDATMHYMAHGWYEHRKWAG